LSPLRIVPTSPAPNPLFDLINRFPFFPPLFPPSLRNIFLCLISLSCLLFLGCRTGSPSFCYARYSPSFDKILAALEAGTFLLYLFSPSSVFFFFLSRASPFHLRSRRVFVFVVLAMVPLPDQIFIYPGPRNSSPIKSLLFPLSGFSTTHWSLSIQ